VEKLAPMLYRPLPICSAEDDGRDGHVSLANTAPGQCTLGLMRWREASIWPLDSPFVVVALATLDKCHQHEPFKLLLSVRWFVIE
jgi:hypothetical protein